jgi:hypothetical protein
MITALLVSVNYSDYLEIALPYNTKQFDQIIVLTVESDKACQDLCNKYSNVKCLVFPDRILKKNGKQFNKGAILNAGFRYLNERNYSDWLVLTDSDIIFPENFKDFFLSKEKNKDIMYGMDRKHCFDKQTLNTYMKTKNDELLKTLREWGPCIGCCQIFFYTANKFSYSENNDAQLSDLHFLMDFLKIKTVVDSPLTQTLFNKVIRPIVMNNPNVNSQLLKELFLIHLGDRGKNWKGRVTNLFK